MRTNSDLGFYDVVNRYGNVLWGLGAVLYLILASTVFFAVQQDNAAGLEQSRAVNYFCLISIAVLCISIARQWTWPIKVDEALLAVFIWVLVTNLLPRDCACCSENTPPLSTLDVKASQAQPPPPKADSMRNGEPTAAPLHVSTIKEPYKEAADADEADGEDEFVVAAATAKTTRAPTQADEEGEEQEEEVTTPAPTPKKKTKKQQQRQKRDEEGATAAPTRQRTRSFHAHTNAGGGDARAKAPSQPARLLNYYTAAAGDQCNWTVFYIVYSLLAVAPMLVSFLINARSRAVSVLSSVLSLLLMLGATLIPISCNQFDPANVNLNLIKFTLYCIIWLVNKQMRLTETVLSNEYIKSIERVRAFRYRRVANLHGYDALVFEGLDEDFTATEQPLLHTTQQELDEARGLYFYYPTAATGGGGNKKKNKKKKGRQATAVGLCAADAHPVVIFRALERLDDNVKKRHDKKLIALIGGGGGGGGSSLLAPGKNKKRTLTSRPYQGTPLMGQSDEELTYDVLLYHLRLVTDVHRRSVEGRWLNSFFSWKNRFYDAALQNIYDLTRTIWILNVCPNFLAFIILEYLFIVYNIRYNKHELAELMPAAKSMAFIYNGDAERHQQQQAPLSGAT